MTSRFDLQKIATDYGLPIEEVRTRYLALKVARWKADFPLFARECLKIRNKEGEIVPLILNEAQMLLHEAGEKMLADEKWIRIIALKGRRQGYSTYVEARGYWRATLWNNQNIYILTHEMAATEALFGMVETMQQYNPFPPSVGTDNAKTLQFAKRGSHYSVATAGQKAGGRGKAVSFFHGSEVALWSNAEDHFGAAVQSVDEVRGKWGVFWREPQEGVLPFEMGVRTVEGWLGAPSEIWMESTSQGPTGAFYKRYMEALKSVSRYKTVFAPWRLQKEYSIDGDWTPGEEPESDGGLSEREYQEAHELTDGQMLWRREKIQEMGSLERYTREFPCDLTEAWSVVDGADKFIDAGRILRARKRKPVVVDGPLVIGVDPAGAGGDRFAVVGRRGDRVEFVRFRNKIDQDEAVAWLSRIIDEEKPSRMNVDRGAMGAAIVLKLKQVKESYAGIVRGVDFGGTSDEKKAAPGKCGPVNVRASIWGRMKEWLVEGSIPDDDDLASDLNAPKIAYRQNNDWILESKSTMRDRGVRSPDLADALSLTFRFKEFFSEYSPAKPTTKGLLDPAIYNTYSGGNYNSNSWMS